MRGSNYKVLCIAAAFTSCATAFVLPPGVTINPNHTVPFSACDDLKCPQSISITYYPKTHILDILTPRAPFQIPPSSDLPYSTYSAAETPLFTITTTSTVISQIVTSTMSSSNVDLTNFTPMEGTTYHFSTTIPWADSTVTTSLSSTGPGPVVTPDWATGKASTLPGYTPATSMTTTYTPDVASVAAISLLSSASKSLNSIANLTVAATESSNSISTPMWTTTSFATFDPSSTSTMTAGTSNSENTPGATATLESSNANAPPKLCTTLLTCLVMGALIKIGVAAVI